MPKPFATYQVGTIALSMPTGNWQPLRTPKLLDCFILFQFQRAFFQVSERFRTVQNGSVIMFLWHLLLQGPGIQEQGVWTETESPLAGFGCLWRRLGWILSVLGQKGEEYAQYKGESEIGRGAQKAWSFSTASRFLLSYLMFISWWLYDVTVCILCS